MTTEDVVKQQIAVGDDIHLHDGVWWTKASLFFYKPVNPLQVIESGKARPKMHKALLGYSHIVLDDHFANKHWSVLLLNNEKLQNFSIHSLSSAKRAQVRKGLKLIEIRKIESIGPVIEDIRNICISAATRTQHGKPPEYYLKYYNKWRYWITHLFDLPNREWWGSFCNGTLVAYFYALQINDTMIIEAAKSHTDFLDKCPNDALLFSFLEYCRNLHDCKKVVYGDWSNDAPSLNTFKQKYGFERVDLPVHVKYNPLVSIVKRINMIVHQRRYKEAKV